MDEQLERTKGKIGEYVISFFERRISSNRREFYGYDLYTWVKNQGVQCSPSSADRVMREMSASEELGYTLLDRSRSLYHANWVGTEQLSLFEGSV